MTYDIKLSIDASALSSSLGAAGAEISRVAREEIAPAAALIETAFAPVASSIEKDLSRAARSGELSLKGLARSIVNDLKRIVIDTLVRKPLENLFSGLFAAPFGGGRAGGGFAARGQSFLVGERGPEVFTPSVSGRISAPSGRNVSVNITLPGVSNADSFRHSETQIAAALQRALAKGERNL
jgi:phage-related minor tail protein